MAGDTLQVDLDVVLPHAHDERDRCVSDLVSRLDGLDGVESVHVINEDQSHAAQVCLHLQPGSVALPRLEQRVRSAGAAVGERYGHLLLDSVPAGHASRAAALTARVRSLDGVVDAAVSIEGVVRVEYEREVTSSATLRGELARLGIRADERHGHRVPSTPETVPDHDHRQGDGRGHGHGARRVELIAAFVSLAIYAVARTLDWFTSIGAPVTGLYVAAAGITGVFVAQDAWLSTRARVFDVDQLMLVAAIGAAFIEHWSDAALLLVLFSLGHALEGYAMNRARSAIESLADLAPAMARRRSEPTVEVSIEELAVGDVVLVRPNERMPADGVIVAGSTSVDESAITGESLPVDKTAAGATAAETDLDSIDISHRVFAGTLNGAGAIDVVVRRVAADSTLSRVVQLVAEAETQISPSQRLTKRVVRVFVPAVLLLVIGLVIVPPVAGEAFRESFGRAMAVLVAASPCALAIATPSAVLAAIARAARSGILVKGGGPLEALGSVSAVAFDKTGTLTEGKPKLTDVVPAPTVDRETLLQATLAIEQSIDHPLARAITTALANELADGGVEGARAVYSVPGKGVLGELAGEQIMIGNVALFDTIAVPRAITEAHVALEGSGRTTMIVRHGDRFLGVLGLMDTARPAAKATIEQLRSIGIRDVVLLSGDNQRVATAIAAGVGIDEARGGLLPADKVAVITELSAGPGVAMVGDGVNDAPALAAADVGIAMGAAGSDVALETADIALMSDRLELLPFAIDLGRRASRTIKQNLFFSLGVVAVLIPMTLLGVGISAAVIAHEGSTLVVVANALRLMNHRDTIR